jgi:hypothetical protein
MTISMYKASVPIFVQFLTSLSAWLDKAAAHAEAKKIDPAVLEHAPLSGHVSAGAAGAGGDRSRDQRMRTPRRRRAATFANTEASIPELDALLRQSTGRFPASRSRTRLHAFAFACNAICRLRHPAQSGVELGKRDFMGTAPQL